MVHDMDSWRRVRMDCNIIDQICFQKYPYCFQNGIFFSRSCYSQNDDLQNGPLHEPLTLHNTEKEIYFY